MLFWYTVQMFAKWSAKAGVATGPGGVSSLESMIRSAKTVHFGIHRVSFQIVGSMLPSHMTLRKCPNLSEPPYCHLLDENKNLL